MALWYVVLTYAMRPNPHGSISRVEDVGDWETGGSIGR